MDSTILNFIIGAIGCITGTISLIILIRQHKFDKGKIIVELSTRKRSYYFNPKGVTNYQSECGAVISLKVINKSAYPTTIDEIYAVSGEHKRRHDSSFTVTTQYLKKKDGGLVKGIEPEPMCILPLKFDPFETKFFSVCFPFFMEFVSEFGQPAKAKLLIITARKEKKINVVISEHDSQLRHITET